MQNSSNSNSPEPEINERFSDNLGKNFRISIFHTENFSMGDEFRTIVKMLTLKLKSIAQKCENMSKILFHVD